MVRHQVMDPEDITKLTEEKFRRTNLQQSPAEYVGALTLPLDVVMPRCCPTTFSLEASWQFLTIPHIAGAGAVW